MPVLRLPGYPLINVVITQVAWFVAVTSGAGGHWWPGVAAVSTVVAVHLLVSARPGHEGVRLVLAGLFGFAADSLLGYTGACSWSGGAAEGRLPPAWLTALWLNFATMLTASLMWLVPRWRLAMAFGAVGGPLAYLAGARLGALSFPHGAAIGLTAVGLCWAVAMAVLVYQVGHRLPTSEVTHG